MGLIDSFLPLRPFLRFKVFYLGVIKFLVNIRRDDYLDSIDPDYYIESLSFEKIDGMFKGCLNELLESFGGDFDLSKEDSLCLLLCLLKSMFDRN